MKEKEKNKVKLSKKLLSFVPRILYNVLIFFCIILIVIIVMQRFTDSNRSILGLKIFKVVSGSMVPKYDIGEVVICKDTPIEEIKIGDAIVYRGKIGELKNRIVMHEVVAINYDENNEIKFYAKGLNNSKGDPEISENQLMGVVVVKSFILSMLYQLTTSIYSSFVIITILVINVFVSFKSGSKEDDDEKEEKITNNIQSEVQDGQTEKLKELEEQNKIENNKMENIENETEKDNQTETTSVTTKKTVSKKENVVIDSEQESDKIETVENSKSKNTVKKTTSKSTKTSKNKIEKETKSSAKSKK